MMLFDDPDGERDDDDRDAAAPPGETARREGLQPPRQSVLCLGHENVENDILPQIDGGRIPHAMIFAGPEGIGKSTFAFRLARYLFSRGTPGDDAGGLFGEMLPAVPAAGDMNLPPDHPDFRKVASGGHPDLLTVERQFDEKRGRFKGILDVEQVRRIPPFMRMTAAQGGWRIVIVDDADTMNRAAQNAILKILEEPPPNALLLLIAHNPGQLIPTIRSRCRMVAFEPLDTAVFTRILRENHPALSDKEITTLHAIAGGSAGQGLRLVTEGGLEAVDKVMGLLHGWPSWDWPQIHLMADVISKPGQDDSLQAFQDVLLWIVRSLLQAKARGQALTGPLAGNDALQRMLAHYSLAQFLAVSDAVHDHFATAEHANLDRRHTVMGAFSALSGAA